MYVFTRQLSSEASSVKETRKMQFYLSVQHHKSNIQWLLGNKTI